MSNNAIKTIIKIFTLFIISSYLYANANIQLDLSINESSVKNHLQPLSINLNINNQTSETIDLYLAVSTPQQELYFIQANELFGNSYNLSTDSISYTSNLPPGNFTGIVYSLNSLPSTLAYGYYTFYALAIKSGEDVFKVENWLSLLAETSLFISDSDTTLAIPTLLKGIVNEQGQTVFNLNLLQGQHSFLTGTTTETFGINGNYLGPTIRVSNNNSVLFNIKNELGEDTTIHWHGAHVPAKMDGGPHQIIKSGESWHPQFSINQVASTLWYHPHLLGKTAEHVIKGLAGFFIIDDEVSKQLAIPQNYGVDDIPIVIQDRIINADGTMPYELFMMHDVMRGYRGDKILANGVINPIFNAGSELIRLRLLNGSNARIYNLGFNDNRLFYQIASDGGFLENPVPLQRLRLSPGERGEVLVDLRNDLKQTLKLISYSSEITSTLTYTQNMTDSLDRSDFDIMDIHISREGTNKLTIPVTLTTINRFEVAQANTTRSFVLRTEMGMGMGMGINSGTNFTINNKSMDMTRIDETIKLGDTEVWEIRNDSSMAHPFHVHDIQFQIIDRNGKTPEVNENGWKDTVLLLPDERVRIMAQFKDYADTEIPYMYHCHILEHEDAGMMGQFLIIP